LLLEEMAKYLSGSLVLTGKVRRAGTRGEKHVECRCTLCGGVSLVYPSNIRLGKTTSCRCQRAVKYGRDPRAGVLGDRYDAILQRCTASSNALFKNYGARGVELRFDSREHFIRWMLEHLPHDSYREVQIDRIDNGGHYEPGNLRLVSQRENLRNKRTNHWVDYFGERVVLADLYDRIVQDFPDFTLARATVLHYSCWKERTMSVVAILQRGGVFLNEIEARRGRMSTTS